MKLAVSSIRLSEEVQSVLDEVVQIRRQVHQYPEPGFQEFETSKLIQSSLKRAGVQLKTMAKTGVVGLIPGGKKTLLVRADIDCLPVKEQNDVPFKSKRDGFMHACGHDAHVAMALGAATVLSKLRSKLNCGVKFMFQPAEEGPGGAGPMIQEGILENPKVDTAIALHVWSDLPVGQVGVRRDHVYAASEAFSVKIIGRGGHGAAPHQTIDPVVAAADFVMAVQTVVSRKIDPIQPAVVTVGKFQGGNRFNIIPAFVELEGTIRSLEESINRKIRAEVKRTLDGTAKRYGVKYELKFFNYYPPTINNRKVADFVAEVAAGIVGKRSVVEQEPSLGGEDMSLVQKRVPSAYIMIGVRNDKKGINSPHHCSTFSIDEDGLAVGTQLIVNTALAYGG